MWEHEGKKWAIVVPFAHPKDKIRAKVYKNDRFCSFADFVEIIERCDELRGGEGDRNVHPDKGCKYFGTCGGCQLQDVPYPEQLKHKLRTVDLAYKRFSGLATDKVPEILPTIGSPIQWGYRTKITPHFNAVPKWARPEAAAAEEEAGNERPDWQCNIGFDRKGKPGVLDIEVSWKSRSKLTSGMCDCDRCSEREDDGGEEAYQGDHLVVQAWCDSLVARLAPGSRPYPHGGAPLRRCYCRGGQAHCDHGPQGAGV